MTPVNRCVWTVVAAAIAFIPGCAVGLASAFKTEPPVEFGKAIALPHHIPKSPDAVAFRFAMAHDVIHERFPKHGPAFYRERERLARSKLATLPPDSDEALALRDDIGAGLDRLGKPADAVPLLREKLKLQEQRGLSGRALYTTYANLGTFLVHANMKAAMTGNADAKAAVKEGLALVEKSIEVNPNAHFGREMWQVVIGRFLLAAINEPELLTTFDCIGDRLDKTFPAEVFSLVNPWNRDIAFARPYENYHLVTGALAIESADRRPMILKVGLEHSWDSTISTSYLEPAPFDEPMLGIIGMWRQGGGANPHFALCIGEVMLRVGQRRIAWTAFERAGRLAERYWPDPAKQQFLRDHCAKRQQLIESTLPSGDGAELRSTFEAELAFGMRYQQEYQDYESAKIAVGADIHDEHFFDDFHRERDPIATPPGLEEWIVTQKEPLRWRLQMGTAAGVFASGLVAFLISLFLPRPARMISH